MSIKLLKDPADLHELQDDLESFCYVVIYLALRYLPHNKVSALPVIMANVFEHHYHISTGVFGGNGKNDMVLSRGYIGKDLAFTDNEPLTSWIDAALRLFRDWYLYLDGLDAAPGAPLIGLEVQPLRDHKALGQVFQTALAKKWPQNDKAVDHLPSKGKNKRQLEGADEESGRKKSKSSTNPVTPLNPRLSSQHLLRRSARLAPKPNGTTYVETDKA